MNSTGSPTRLSPASPMKAGTLSQPAPAMDTQKATPAADKALHSRMVQRLHRRYADLLPLLPPGLPRHDSMRTTLFALQQQGHDVGASLRILRQLVEARPDDARGWHNLAVCLEGQGRTAEAEEAAARAAALPRP